MADNSRSLLRTYPHRVDVPLLLLLALAALIVGLTLPVMKVEKLIFWNDAYTLISGSYNLAKDGDWFLAGVIFSFSVIFPSLKLFALAWLWLVPMSAAARARALSIISHLGKWSMLDVFVIAFLVVLTKSKSLGNISAQPGIFVFSGAVILSMLSTWQIQSLARRAANA